MRVADNLKPKLTWLQERLALDDNRLGKLVTTYPMVLNYSIEENLEPMLVWLQDRLGLDDMSLCFVIQRLAQLQY
jgi:ferric-dicitrate binding protein FerR (iron transport regulator)